MKLSDEYKNQNIWRNWPVYLEKVPISSGDTVLDLGCGIGYVTKLLAGVASQVIGIDSNVALLEEAKSINNAGNIMYINGDLRSINKQDLPLADGVWTSFTPAYFPDFAPILRQWLALLKPTGWIAIVEIDDLFAHHPLSNSTREVLAAYYDRQRKAGFYDFEMGSKLKNFFLAEQLVITHEENMVDREFSFHGPADNQILLAWETRLNRLLSLQSLFKDTYPEFKNEFLSCLTDTEHISKTQVKFIVARKNR